MDAAVDWRAYPALAGKDHDFLASVAGYLPLIEALSSDQRQRLALFKAAELFNALIQIREQREDPQRLGAELAQASFALVRAVIRDRSMPLPDGAAISLRDPELQQLIDLGCQLFHRGKSDPALYQQALALSAAQCIALHELLEPALQHYVQICPFPLPPALCAAVRTAFISAYEPAADANGPDTIPPS